MTEHEWLTAQHSAPLIQFIRPKASDRKLHYFDIACARRLEPLLIQPASLHAIDVLERYTEGQCDADELRALSYDVEVAAFCVEAGHTPYQEAAEQLSHEFLAEFIANPAFSVRSARDVLTSAAYFVDGIFSPVPYERQRTCFRPVSLVHEIFGNPFRTIRFRRAWRTDTVLALARQMYESRDFSAMPILADALQDAGCDSADVLNHCRDAHAIHVRGCWVVDGVLNKT
jgi:hypothetical protein